MSGSHQVQAFRAFRVGALFIAAGAAVDGPAIDVSTELFKTVFDLLFLCSFAFGIVEAGCPRNDRGTK